MLKERLKEIEQFENGGNPFENCNTDIEVMEMAERLVNENGSLIENKTENEDFSTKMGEKLLLAACILYLKKYRPTFQQNVTSVIKLLRAVDKIGENETQKVTKLDRLFDEISVHNPGALCCRLYSEAVVLSKSKFNDVLISLFGKLEMYRIYEECNALPSKIERETMLKTTK